jgi:peptidoglycan LD-endopeptidase CwlK
VEGPELVLCSGQRMPLLDVAPMFAEAYPSELSGEPTTDPGRTRHEPFFRALYGADKAAVRSSLTTVVWMPRTVGRKLQVTSHNGVAAQLQKVSDELDRLPPGIRRIVADTSGTFVWRKIRGTDRLSMHSFAIAIDVGVPNADFWRWRKTYRNRMPLEVVAIFEKHGFIWGGKWLHFDTMHFEYRPELLHPLCVR